MLRRNTASIMKRLVFGEKAYNMLSMPIDARSTLFDLIFFVMSTYIQ